MPIDKSGKFIDQVLVDRIRPPDLATDLVRAVLTKESIVTFTKASHVDDFGAPSCNAVLIWIMAGRSFTNQKGEYLLNLNRILCLKHDEETDKRFRRPHITNEPWFVANALSNSPVLITTSYEITPLPFPNGELSIDQPQGQPNIFEVVVKVMSWNLDGSFAPKIDFSWHCIAEGVRSITLGG